MPRRSTNPLKDLTQVWRDALQPLRAVITEVLRPWHENEERFHEALTEAEEIGVDPRRIKAMLLPQNTLLRELHATKAVAEIVPLSRLIARLRSNLDSATKEGLSEDQLAKLRRLIGQYQRQLDRLVARATRLGFGEGRVGVPTDATFWDLTPGEIQEGSYNLKRAGFVGDRGVKLYKLLAPRMALQRRQRGLKRLNPKDVTYNQAALDLTARLVSAAYWPSMRHITAADVKSRLRTRAAQRASRRS